MVVRLALCAPALAIMACGGKGPTEPTGPPAIPPPGATVAMVEEGKTLFRQGSCAQCHGQNGAGRAFGPPLGPAPDRRRGATDDHGR